MKKIFSLASALMMLAVLFLTTNANAQGGAPNALNYQAVARNSSGSLIANQSIKVRFTFHANSAAGTIEYQETQNLTTNQYGLFSAVIGQGTVTQGSWAGITFGSADQFLQVEFDPTGGSSYSNMGTSQLVSVPYALNAKTAETALDSYWSASGPDIENTNVGTVSIGGAPSGFSLLSLTPAGGLDAIDIADPVDGYALYCVKSGASSGIWMEKTSTTSSTPAINGIANGPNAGVEGSHNSTGIGVAGYTQSGIGVHGEAFDQTLGMAGTFSGRLSVTYPLSNNASVADRLLFMDAAGAGVTYYPGMTLGDATISLGGIIYGKTSVGGGFQFADYDGVTYAPVDALAFNVMSDARFKRDITEVKSGNYSKYMSYIRNIESATFFYNSESAEQRSVPHIGVIAQTLPLELQAKVGSKPGVATQDRLAVSLADFAGLSLIGIKAIDEKQTTMEQTIKTQQEEIELLKAQLKAIQTKLDAIKK